MSVQPVVVVGAGLMGAAAAWSLSRRGRAVVVLEQFEPGHVQGSSHGSARIVRRAYGDGLYTQLTGRAFELWREVELAAETDLLRILGGLDFGPRRNVTAVAAHLVEHGVEHEVLPPAEAQSRWPGMRFDGDVVHHPQAGTVDTHRAIEAMLTLAQAHGAQLRTGVTVTAIEPGETTVAVRTGTGERLDAEQVVVAAGGWVSGLLDGLVALPPLTVTQEQVFHFDRLDTTQPPWPSVIHEGLETSVFHLAGGRDGGSGDARKVGDHHGGKITTAADRDGVVDDAARLRAIDYVTRWLPGLDPTPHTASTCLYTRTPSEDFLLDRVGRVVVCSPCSGHGAKFAPLIGEQVADLVTGAGGVPDRFRLAWHATAAAGSVSL